MPKYQAPIKDSEFILNDVFNIYQYSEKPRFSNISQELISAVLTESAKLVEEVIAPLNQSGDKEGCNFKNGEVKTPNGYIEAYNKYIEGAWPGLCAESQYGGAGLPNTIGAVMGEFVSAANMSFAMYPGLSEGAYRTIERYGDEKTKELYLPKLVAGTWTGTMNLTEAHCGTDLGLIKTKALPQNDGSYNITGSKIFISAGEHDLAENIIHLVLARIEGAPKGTKGLSLFIVPKFIVQEDGSIGERNKVNCGSIEEKMGIHGNSTCVMNYDNAKGFLLGIENAGMKAMFTMMNAARIYVGIQGLSQSEVAYQNALTYAKDRLQGRSITGEKFPKQPADPIIVHADVRRMLLEIKSFNEAARALIIWTSIYEDIYHNDPESEEGIAAYDMVSLLTPIVKGFITDIGFENTINAQQVYGGHGYIKEWGVEQFVRDARIAMIYEGTNGIQALDLVGRKLAKNGGRALMGFFKTIDDFIKENKNNSKMEEFISPIKQSRDDLEKATQWFMENAMSNHENAAAGATEYMHLFGYVTLGLMWGYMVKAATENKEKDPLFMKTKLKTAKFFMQRMLPTTTTHLTKIISGSEILMDFSPEEF